MKTLLLLCLMAISFCQAQKITIDPDLVVGKTDFDIIIYKDDYKDVPPNKANIIVDIVSKD